MVGFDIAGAEKGFPPTRHLDAFEYVRQQNAHVTIHAGEAFGLPSIWEAIQWCGAHRLGHGVRIVDDITLDEHGEPRLGRLAAYVRDSRIPLEMCPTSNVHTGAAPSIADHPIGLLARLRFRVTVNTDNRLMSGCSMTSEMLTLARDIRVRLGRPALVHDQRDEVGLLPLRLPAGRDRGRDQAGVRRIDGMRAFPPQWSPRTEMRRTGEVVTTGRGDVCPMPVAADA